MQDALLNGATYNPLEALRRRADKENRFPNRRLKTWDLTPTEAIITDDPSKKAEKVVEKDEVEEEDAAASIHSVVINDVERESTVSPTGTTRGSPATLHVITETASIDEKEVSKKRHSGFHLPKLFKKKQSVTATPEKKMDKVQETVSVSPTVVLSRPKTPITATSDTGVVSPTGIRPSSSDEEAFPNPAVSSTYISHYSR